MEIIFSIGFLNLEDTIYPHRPVFEKAAGGAALYFALGGNLWGNNVALVSRIGDNYPSEYIKLLQDGKINTDFIKVMPGSTMSGETSYDAEGNRKYTMYTPPRRRFDLSPSPDDWVIPEIGQERHYHLATMPPAIQLAWLEKVDTDAKCISVDTDISFIESERGEVSKLLKKSDVFFPNQDEAKALASGDSLEERAKKIAFMGPKIVAIKLGQEGAFIYEKENDRVHNIPAIPSNVVDVTGAGDAFAGGFVAGLVNTGNVFEAGWRGAVTASMAIEDYGSLHLLNRTREEALGKIRTFRARRKR
jgi:sugar/nucleoside kinase (ribokinase family)